MSDRLKIECYEELVYCPGFSPSETLYVVQTGCYIRLCNGSRGPSIHAHSLDPGMARLLPGFYRKTRDSVTIGRYICLYKRLLRPRQIKQCLE